MEFIENKEKYGVKYDLLKIAREYKKLKIPQEYDYIDFSRFEKNKYIIDLSIRSVGKTTDYLLLGMIFNKIYGTKIAYIRTTKDEIAPSVTEKIFNVIQSFNDGFYIKKLTDNKYNGIYRKWNNVYYCKIDENGNIVEKSTDEFMHFLCVEKFNDYKSGLSVPMDDFIIYDEFITKYYRPNTHYEFMQLLSTIIRERLSPFIVMLANSININSVWFEEMGIRRDIRHMTVGDCKDIVTSGGTCLSVRLLDVKAKEQRRRHSSLFFGFENPKLKDITGIGGFWSISNYKHIPTGLKLECIGRPLFIHYLPGEFLRLEFSIYKNKGILIVKKATRVKDDDIVLTTGDVEAFEKCHWGFGSNKLQRYIYDLILNDRVYYGTNENGEDFKNYCLTVFQKNILN